MRSAGAATWVPYALVVAVRLATLGDPLANDEAGSAVVGRSWLTGESALDAGSVYGAYWFDRPPLLPLLYGLADLAGGAAGVRLLGVAAALALVFLVGRIAGDLAGARAATIARFVAAPLVVAAPMQADRTYGELLAAVPATLAVWLLVRICVRAEPRDATRARWWTRDTGEAVLAGVAATCAVLVKQSALDALVVALVLLAARRLSVRIAAAGVLGIVAPVALVAVWAATSAAGASAVLDAVVGFRLDQLGASAADDAAPLVGVVRLVVPAVLSGLVIALVVAVGGLVQSRGWRRAVLLGWFAGAAIGVLGGGFYWPHYLVQLAAPVAVAASLVLAVPGRDRRVVVGVCGVLAALAIVGPALRPLVPHTGRLDARARSVGEDVARRADDDDRILVLTARPGVVHASGLRSASPWLWQAMVQSRPGVGPRLLSILEARDAPEWVVTWDSTTTRFAEHDRIQRTLRERYRRVASHGPSGVWERR